MANNELTPITSILENNLISLRQNSVNHEEGQLIEKQLPITPIGVVKYGKEQNLYGVGVDATGHIQSQIIPHAEIDQSIDLDAIFNRRPGRVLDLTKYEQVDFFQADLAPVDVKSQKSLLREGSSLHVRIQCKNMQGDIQDLWLTEEDMFDLVLGKKGGIAVLHGSPYPEENALIIEGAQSENPSAAVVFLTPEQRTLGFESIEGVYTLFKRFNRELLATGVYPLSVTYDVENLYRYFEQHFRGTGDSARIELFVSSYLAQLRMAKLTNNQSNSSLREIQGAIHALQNQFWGLFQGRDKKLHGLFTELIDKAVQTAVINDRQQMISENNVDIQSPFKTSDARDIDALATETLGDKYGSESYDTFIRESHIHHLRNVMDFFNRAYTIDQIDDALSLVDKLKGTKFSGVSIRYKAGGIRPDIDKFNPNNYGFVDTESSRAVSSVLYDMKEALLSRKAQQIQKQFEEKKRR